MKDPNMPDWWYTHTLFLFFGIAFLALALVLLFVEGLPPEYRKMWPIVLTASILTLFLAYMSRRG